MHPVVLKSATKQEFDTRERCWILEISNDADDDAASIARARVEPGVTTAWHSLRRIAERYLIVAGEGRVEIGDLEPVDVAPGDVVRIPPGMRQRITNTGARDLIFYAICTPRFDPDRYEALE